MQEDMGVALGDMKKGSSIVQLDKIGSPNRRYLNYIYKLSPKISLTCLHATLLTVSSRLLFADYRS